MSTLTKPGTAQTNGLAAKIEQKILEHRLPLLQDDLPAGELVMPHYDGYSIVNIPATTAAMLDVPLPGAPPLPQDVWRPFSEGVRCVVRIIIDALGYYRLQRFMTTEPDTSFHQLLRRGGYLFPLTSVCPSTTTTALSSLWTGRVPIEHGMLGTRLFLRDQGIRANLIFFSPVSFKSRNILLDEGMKPAEFLPVPGMGDYLAKEGIESHVFIGKQYASGGLSDIFFRGVKELHPFVSGSGADLWTMLRDFMEQRAGEKLFISVYWGSIDALSHERGPSSSVIDAELLGWSELMTREFLDQLSSKAAAGTLLMILADHGQVDSPPAKAVRLDQHPDFVDHLLMKPLGEQRLPYLFARRGRTEALRCYVRERLSQSFAIIEPEQALEAGLFGSGSPAKETAARLGDFILVSRQDHMLFDGNQDPHLLGLHGGLSAEEMLVPCLFVRLDR
jgi:hypothetical protein